MAGAEARARIRRIGEMPLRKVGRPSGVLAGTAYAFREVWGRRELVWLLSKREIRARYKDASLGLLWSLARPLAQLAIYYFAIGKVLGVERAVPQFAIFVFVGITGWSLFTEIIQRATVSITLNGGLVKKVYLPREVFPLSSVGSAIFSFAVQVVILALAMILLGQVPHPADLWYAALGVLVLGIFGLALGLALAALNVYMRDFEHLVEVGIVVMFWASPIVYSFAFVDRQLSAHPALEGVYLSNPVTIAVLGLQRGLWKAGVDDPVLGVWPEHLGWLLAAALGVSMVLLLLAQQLFTRLQGNFAQEV